MKGRGYTRKGEKNVLEKLLAWSLDAQLNQVNSRFAVCSLLSSDPMRNSFSLSLDALQILLPGPTKSFFSSPSYRPLFQVLEKES